jgi:hypothetical protein
LIKSVGKRKIVKILLVLNLIMILGISGYIIYIKLGLKKNLVKKETKEVYSG